MPSRVAMFKLSSFNKFYKHKQNTTDNFLEGGAGSGPYPSPSTVEQENILRA